MPKNLVMAASLPAPLAPDKLFDMYLDAAIHTAFTGRLQLPLNHVPAFIFVPSTAQFPGTILHVEPKRLIVQTWRSVNFSADDIDSVLVLSFWPENDCARIELAQINVAANDFAGVSQGWEKYYWTPWRAYLLWPPVKLTPKR